MRRRIQGGGGLGFYSRPGLCMATMWEGERSIGETKGGGGQRAVRGRGE